MRTGSKSCGTRYYYRFRVKNHHIDVRLTEKDKHVDLSREELYVLKGLVEQQEQRCAPWTIPQYVGDVQKSIAILGLPI